MKLSKIKKLVKKEYKLLCIEMDNIDSYKQFSKILKNAIVLDDVLYAVREFRGAEDAALFVLELICENSIVMETEKYINSKNISIK